MRTCQKFFGCSVISRTKISVWLSSRIPTSTKGFLYLRGQTGVNFKCTRSRLFSMRVSTSSLTARTMQAGFFLILQGRGGLLATYGSGVIPLFSKVHAFYVFLSFFLTPCHLLDVCGTLEGESLVGDAIQGVPDVWCFEEPPLSLVSESESYWQQMPLANWNSSSVSSRHVTATRITSAEGILIRDWREPIHRMLEFRDFNVRIASY